MNESPAIGMNGITSLTPGVNRLSVVLPTMAMMTEGVKIGIQGIPCSHRLPTSHELYGRTQC